MQPSHHHNPIAFELVEKTDQPIDAGKYIERNVIDHNLLKDALSKIPVRLVPNRRSVVMQLEKIVEAFKSSTITRRIKSRSFGVKHPWLIGDKLYMDIRKEIQCIQRSHNHSLLKRKRKQLHQRYHQLKSQFCEQKLTTSSNPNDLFNYMKILNKKNELPAKMKFHGTLTCNPADSMATHLATVFEGVADSLYQGNYSDNIRAIWEEHYVYNENYHYVGNFHPTEVYNTIQSLDKKKDPGSMQIQPKDVIMHAEILADVLTPIFNACVLVQWTPPFLLKSILVPVPKSGNKSEVTNYRGIAINNTLCKILDKLITSRLSATMEPFLPDSQYGFRKARSTTGCLFDATQFISEQMKWTQCVDAAFLDVSKAFDHISHATIAASLSAIGMSIDQLKFVMNFINNREFHLRFNGQINNTPIVPDAGVPQGSCIGPKIFILVAAAIRTKIHPSTTIYQYADDILLVQPIDAESDERALQCSITGVMDWATDAGMAINVTKSSIMKFTRKQTYL